MEEINDAAKLIAQSLELLKIVKCGICCDNLVPLYDSIPLLEQALDKLLTTK